MERRDLLTSVALLSATGGIPSSVGAAEDAGMQNAQGVSGPRVSTDDYIEIVQLYYRYCHAFDTAQSEALADLFTEDGEFTGGRGPGQGNEPREPRKGRANFLRMGTVGGLRHFVTNIVVTKTPEGANGSCYLLLYDVKTLPPSFVETAIYNDVLVKTKAGWRFKKRTVWRDDDDITPFKAKPRA